jgi:hypothetical protein
MDFLTLHEKLPYVMGKETHILTYSPYKGINLLFPGRHQKDTVPIGGDFVVEVTDKLAGWKNHQFTHDDLFEFVEIHPANKDLMGN